MTDHLKKLRSDELQDLLDAIPLITLLIAGADGNFEEEELEWSKKIAHIRGYKMKGEVKTFYQEVNKDIEQKLQFFMETLPADVEQRSQKISEKLSGLNHVLAKLDPALGAKLYKSFISLAEHVAKASGGVIGFFSINKEEAKWIGLPMINPVYHQDNEEE